MGFVKNNPNPSYSVALVNDQGQPLRTLRISTSLSNCKLAIVDNIGSALSTAVGVPAITPEQKVEFITQAKQMVPNRNLLIHTTDETIFAFLRDNFPYYYANEVPIGYGTGNQYHVLLKNNTDVRPPILPKAPVKKVNKNKLLEIVSNAFDKTLNRKKRLEIIQQDLNNTELLEP